MSNDHSVRRNNSALMYVAWEQKQETDAEE